MTTTEPTTFEAPTWLNVDALAPADLLGEVAKLTIAMQALIDQAVPLAERVVAVHERVEDACRDAVAQIEKAFPAGDVPDLHDAVGELVSRATRYHELHCLVLRLTQDLFDDVQ